MTDTREILVAGATGMQGGATVEALLERGFGVRALTRDPKSARSQELATQGVKIVSGDFEDAAALAEAMRGAYGVFSVQMPPISSDTQSELRTGQSLIDAAKAAGVQVFVHTSVARAGDQEQFVDWDAGRWWPDYWTSKSGVNDAVKAAGFPHWVILKPAFMMENLLPPKAAWMFPQLKGGSVDTAMKADTKLHFISASDVGRFAAAAFAEPEKFDGKEIDLAAEMLTMGEVAATIADVTGLLVKARALSGEAARAAGNHAGLVESQQWANVEGYKVDLAKANSHGLTLESFRDWATRNRDRFDIDG